MIVYEIECQECNATYEIKHHLNTSRYDIAFCSFCGSDKKTQSQSLRSSIFVVCYLSSPKSLK